MHSQLVEVLMRFQTHRVAITADVSKMYRAILGSYGGVCLKRLAPITDYRMTRVTFGVAASCFVANMAVHHALLAKEKY